MGKYVGGAFEIEPYQTAMLESTRQKLALMCRSDEVRNVVYGREVPESLMRHYPKMATMVSGSAVIADDRARDSILKQHRNIDGIEMELSAVFRAAELLDASITVIGAKGVADFADEHKNDDVQNFSAVASGRFIVEAIENVLCDDSEDDQSQYAQRW